MRPEIVESRYLSDSIPEASRRPCNHVVVSLCVKVLLTHESQTLESKTLLSLRPILEKLNLVIVAYLLSKRHLWVVIGAPSLRTMSLSLV